MLSEHRRLLVPRRYRLPPYLFAIIATFYHRFSGLSGPFPVQVLPATDVTGWNLSFSPIYPLPHSPLVPRSDPVVPYPMAMICVSTKGICKLFRASLLSQFPSASYAQPQQLADLVVNLSA